MSDKPVPASLVIDGLTWHRKLGEFDGFEMDLLWFDMVLIWIFYGLI